MSWDEFDEIPKGEGRVLRSRIAAIGQCLDAQGAVEKPVANGLACEVRTPAGSFLPGAEGGGKLGMKDSRGV